jgi:hypothetical protein
MGADDCTGSTSRAAQMLVRALVLRVLREQKRQNIKFTIGLLHASGHKELYHRSRQRQIEPSDTQRVEMCPASRE